MKGINIDHHGLKNNDVKSLYKKTILLQPIASQEEVARVLGVSSHSVGFTERSAFKKIKELAKKRGIDLEIEVISYEKYT